MTKNSSRPEGPPAEITDTCLAGVQEDGTPVYVPQREADLAALASAILYIVEHPREALESLAWMSLAAGSVYCLYSVFNPPRKPVRSRRR
jgi:hypothetical protein